MLVAVAVVLGSLIAILGLRMIGDAEDQHDLTDFYALPTDEPGTQPGALIRFESLEATPIDARAWRVMYWTTDVHGTKVPVTGTVITPSGEPPAEGRKVLAWGHPTTGTAAECAPSRGFDPFLGIEGLRLMLDRGYTVVATDYVGMGTDAPDSYLVGSTAGNSMLDAVRAAQAIPDSQAGDSVILWGHSQGGQAVLFAAQSAATYAPELRVEAAAVAAPAADLSALMSSHLDDVSGVTIGSYAFQAFAQVYADRGAKLDQVLSPQAQQILPEINRLCLLNHVSQLHDIARPVVGHFARVDPTKVEPWATLLHENSAGATGFEAPLFVAQGLQDQLVVPDDTTRFVKNIQRHGVNVDFHTVSVADHATIAYLAIPSLVLWLDEHDV